MKSLDTYLSGFGSPFTVFDYTQAGLVYKPRDPFANKGTFGHALLMAGAYGKIGAAVLASRACLSAGAGLLTVHLPACGYEIIQTTIPEAMVNIDDEQFHLTSFPAGLETYQSAGIGPGIGLHEETYLMLKAFIKSFRHPLVLDADALNLIGQHPKMLTSLKENTILTPHPKEFDRLFGESKDDLSRMDKALKMAIKYKVIIVLKGHFTGVFTPDGEISFNTNGNAGMAKGGSGDVLTGILTALLAQSYQPKTAAQLGVYLHGAAGDLAAALRSEESMLPSDLIDHLGKVFLELKSSLQK
jgi:ADP-dependent NAD(P)H-hydrate dehydratase / NAD(P)H-hydrate epimerase